MRVVCYTLRAARAALRTAVLSSVLCVSVLCCVDRVVCCARRVLCVVRCALRVPASDLLKLFHHRPRVLLQPIVGAAPVRTRGVLALRLRQQLLLLVLLVLLAGEVLTAGCVCWGVAKLC